MPHSAHGVVINTPITTPTYANGYHKQTDGELVKRCLHGDDQAWATLLDRYSGLIYSVAWKSNLPPEDVGDVFQSVCLVMLQDLEKLKDESKLSSWLTTITLRQCYRVKRRQRGCLVSLDQVEEELTRLADDSLPQDEEIQHIEREQMVRQALSMMEEPCRRLLTHLFYELEETKLQAERLRESEQQFRAVIENATDAVAIIQDGRFRYVNPYGLQMLGSPASNTPDLGFLDVVHPGYRELVARNYARRLQGEVIPPYDVVVVREDGTELLVSLNACLIEYERRPAVLIIARDITESRLLREQILQSEKMAALGQLISGVAHELNNPLTAVIGYSELLRQEEHLPGILQRGLDTIYDSARRAGRIVQNLLTFARQHRGARSEVNINELLERTLALRAYQLRVNNIEVVKELALNLPPTVADGYQLQQVFLNLIINAEQAMLADHGRGRLVIRTQKLPSPDLPSSVDAERIIEIAFSDDGPGIPAAHLNRIFDPFFTTKPVGQGTGLGLSISHSIIHDHGGRIHVRSQPGSGATFIIELPVVRQTGESVTPDAALPLPPKVTRKNVLIVDDEPTIVSLLREIVAAEGHRVDVAANGAQALTKLQQQPYDLIFCDIKMPYLNGRELYQEMKQCNGALTQKMVFVTGDVIGEETRTFLEHTGSRFIEKPFMADDVIRVMRSVLTDEKQNTSEPVAWRANRG